MIPGAIKPYGENFNYKDYEINKNLLTALETITKKKKKKDGLSQLPINLKKLWNHRISIEEL